MRKQFLLTVILAAAVLTVNLFAQNHLNENFEGSYRKNAKTAIVRNKTTKKISTPKAYSSISELLNSLPSDSTVRNKYSDLTGSNGPQKRKTEELRNVEVDCWIYTFKWEGGSTGDRDYHVILGDEPGTTPKRFMNAEISGLPTSGMNLQPLLDARKSFLDLMNNENVNSSTFKHLNSQPIRVKVTGSLFFDGAHQFGCTHCPGTSWAKPQSVWEIHPIYSIDAVQ